MLAVVPDIAACSALEKASSNISVRSLAFVYSGPSGAFFPLGKFVYRTRFAVSFLLVSFGHQCCILCPFGVKNLASGVEQTKKGRPIGRGLILFWDQDLSVFVPQRRA